MTLAARLVALAPHVFPAINAAPEWAALIADAKAQSRATMKEAAE